MADILYFEDFAGGQTFEAGGYTISKEETIAFATQYDPQYFHIDEEAAKKSFFKKLAVSGWHTAAVTMRLKTETELVKVKGGLIGMGLEHMKWPRPVYPGDTLRIVVTVLGARPSNSRPEIGIVRYRVDTFNQKNELVMEGSTAVIVPRRTGA